MSEIEKEKLQKKYNSLENIQIKTGIIGIAVFLVLSIYVLITRNLIIFTILSYVILLPLLGYILVYLELKVVKIGNKINEINNIEKKV
ncbi:MAG: hypothetical protein ACFFCI_01005 [Promethearchaeota archaeon]